MVTLQTLRTEKRDEILRLAKQHGAVNIRVFGSVARGEASEASDLDLLWIGSQVGAGSGS